MNRRRTSGRTWWRLGRRSASRSFGDNLEDSRQLVRSLGPFIAVLWPLYGLFCVSVLGLRDEMWLRGLLAAVCAGLWLRSRREGRWGRIDQGVWLAHSTIGLGWLPWHLYFENAGHPYWQMSIVFFSLAFAVAARGIDLPIGMLLVTVGVVAVDGSEFSRREVPTLAVSVITLWLTFSGGHLLRSAHRRIRDQAGQLERQNQRLKVLDHDKDVFTAGIAHDLRTPLSVAFSLAEDMKGLELPIQARRRLDALGDALGQMRRQSEELLDLQRFQLGIARMDRKTVDIGGWLSRFEAGFSSMARTRGLTFQVVLPSDPLSASVDPVRLETALFNLVSNAFKFTPEGGHVEVHLRRHGAGGFAVAVLDDGEGIPPGALQRIFERFQQVDRGPGTYTAGAGIGLALVREVAEAHGGHVSVQSTLGLGSLFELIFPDSLVDAPPAALELSIQEPAHGRTAPVRPPSAGRLALVAEDQQMLRQVLHDVLERVAKVATARDGREALRLVHELNPDIVVTDFAMPGMDGLQLLAALRSDPATRDIPVVLLSGDPDRLRARLAPEPTIAILGKPFEHRELLGTVQGLLERERLSVVA